MPQHGGERVVIDRDAGAHLADGGGQREADLAAGLLFVECHRRLHRLQIDAGRQLDGQPDLSEARGELRRKP